MSSKQKYSLNPKKTLAILIGGVTYTDFEDIKPAANNLESFTKILKDKKVFGLPANQIKILLDKTTPEIMKGLIDYTRTAKKEGLETLILYFVGHGVRWANGYYLAGKDTVKELVKENKGATGIDYDFVKSTLQKSQIPSSIIFLDACYSGSAIMGEDDFQKEFQMKGSYVITSSESHEVSYFDKEETHTLFSGELLDLLKNGLPNQEEKISLNALYESLREKVKKKNPKMAPQHLASQEITGDNFYFFQNQQFDPIEVKRAEVRKVIREGIQLLTGFRFEEAIRIFNKATRKARPARHFEAEIDEIHERMDECEEKRDLYVAIKTQLEAKYQEELERTLAALEKANKGLAAMEEEQNETELKHEAEVLSLMQELETQKISHNEELKSRETRINTLEKLLEEQETEVTRLNQTIEQLQGAIKPMSAKNDKFYLESIPDAQFTMIHVKGGNFQMGSPKEDDEAYDGEAQHEVRVTDYFIGEFPVTQALWRAVMGSDPSSLHFEGCDDCPVEGVSWIEITDSFLPKLNQLTGKSYRLLTEAEWEFAARGGNQSKGFEYAGSNQLDDVGWYDTNSESKMHPVGGKKPNELGIYDLSGNVYEWCQDWFGSYGKTMQEDPNGPETGSYRVIRGGSWYSRSRYCRVADRGSWRPGTRDDDVGFRLAHSL